MTGGKRVKKKHGKKSRAGKRIVAGKRLILPIAAALLLVAAGIAVWVIVSRHTVRTVSVDGNTRYTDEEITDMVVNNLFTGNTLYLSRYYKDRPITDVPFIERMDVIVTAPDAVRINVYEKALAGYIEYLGQYMYFDREGIVVEASKERFEGVPQVLGLDFGYVVLYERLPVENEEVFNHVLSITKQLEKYELSADRIFFDANYRTYLYFGAVEAELGDSSYIDEKLEQLVHILPDLEGKRGILRMKDYTPQSRGITFEERAQ